MSDITNNSQSVGESAARSPLPDIADIVFCLAIGLLVFVVPNFVLGDGSTGWHLVTGKYILQHGSIPHQDLFSYTFPNKHWVPYEWFADVVMALLEKVGGLKLLAVASSCAIAWLFARIYLDSRRAGCHFVIAMTLTILGVLVSSIHWLARPHLFTWWGVFLFSRHLERFRQGQESGRRLIITLGVTMLIWANAHPAFLVGLAITIIYLVSELLNAMVMSFGAERRASMQRFKIFGTAFGVSVLATLVNPNGFQLYSYIFEYLHSSAVLSVTSEYMPPNFHQLHAICLLLLFALFMVGLAVTRWRIALAPLLTVFAFGYLSVTSVRNEPLLAIIAVPIIAQLFSNFDLRTLFLPAEFAPSRWLEKILGGWRRFGDTIDDVEFTCTMHILPLVLSALLIVSCFFDGKLGPVELVTSQFDPKTKPTTTLDCIKKNGLDPNKGFNLDNWGGYMVYKTGNRVFIDDRLDFYGEPYFMDYGAIVSVNQNWEALLRKNDIQWVLFPKKSTLADNLANAKDWKLLCQDEAAVLYVRL